MSQPYEAVKALMLANSAVKLKSGKRIFHGLKPRTPTLPNIAFFEIGGPSRFNGMEGQEYTINCRAATFDKALDLARVVVDLFHGASSTGTYGTISGFDISRAFQAAPPAIIPESTGSVYNVPVTISIIYPSSTVS